MNLNRGYLDLFQLHGASAGDISEPLLERLQSMKRKGMYRYHGVNTNRQADMLFLSQHPEIVDMVLIDYNVVQIDREPAVDALHRAGIGVVAGTILAQGHLVKDRSGSIWNGSYF